jgi:hypothetical protein
MAVPKFPKAATIRPIYTRGGSPIFDGFEPMGPGTPINTPFPTEIQNPNQIDQSAIQGGVRGSGPVRTGAFGYGVRRQSYGEYNTPITDPRRQEPGAPINQRPIVEIPGEGRGGVGAAHYDGPGREANNSRGRAPSVSEISRPPQSSGMQSTSLRSPLAGVGVQASSVGRSTASSAGKVTVAAPKAAAASSPKAETPTTSTKSTKKTGKSGALLRR